VPQSPHARRARWRRRVGHKLAARASRSAFAAASRPGGRQHRKRGDRRRRPARRSTAPTVRCQENSKPASPSSASPSRPTTRAGVQHRAGAVCRSGVSATSPRPTWTCANASTPFSTRSSRATRSATCVAAANRGGELLAVASPHRSGAAVALARLRQRSPGSYDPRVRGTRRPVRPPCRAALASASRSPLPPALPRLAQGASAWPGCGRGVTDVNRQS